MSLLTEIADILIKGNAPEVEKKVRQALDDGIDPSTILDDGLIAGMNVVGGRFKSGEMYVPEVLIAARAMHKGLDLVKPLIADSDSSNKGTIVLGTVKGDLHDIGKNLVAMMLEGAGFNVVDLGVDVPSEKFIEAVKLHQPELIGLSALLTSTMQVMKDVIDELKESNLNVKIMVGGAPVSQEFADTVGADAYGTDGAEAVEAAQKLMS